MITSQSRSALSALPYPFLSSSFSWLECTTSSFVHGRLLVIFFAEIAQLPDGTYYVSLTATTIDDEEPQLLNQEIDSRRGVSLDEVLAVIKSGLTGSA
jgi:hypothetical protein